MMKRVIALTLCLLMAILTLASCNGSIDPGAEDKGDIFNAFITGDVPSFDPGKDFTDESAVKVLGMIYEGLFRLDEKGNAVAESVVLTAGAPAKIALSADRDAISADGDDLVYITASVVDENGTVCPLADNRLFFSVYGNGELLTTDNGDQRETESFARHDKKVLAGKVVACVRSIKDQPGKLTLKVIADGIGASEIDIDVK